MLEGWLQIALFVAVLVALIKPVGIYIARVFTGRRVFLSPVVGPIDRQPLQRNRVEHGEQRGIGADSHGQRRHCDRRESRTPDKAPKRITNVAPNRRHADAFLASRGHGRPCFRPSRLSRCHGSPRTRPNHSRLCAQGPDSSLHVTRTPPRVLDRSMKWCSVV